MRQRIEIENHGSICLVGPDSPLLAAWFDENVAEYQMFGRMYVVEPRYLNDLLVGLAEAGFEVGGRRF